MPHHGRRSKYIDSQYLLALQFHRAREIYSELNFSMMGGISKEAKIKSRLSNLFLIGFYLSLWIPYYSHYSHTPIMIACRC